MHRTFRLTYAAALLSSVAFPALAQQAGPQPAEPTQVQAAAGNTLEPSAPEQADDSATRSDIIVTGSRSPKAVDHVAGAITVVTLADVQRSLTITEDATAVLARTVPGYSESNQSLNTLGETMRGRTALYLFDGIPQSTPLRDGSRNATFTDMATIERIEVIGGASAAEGIGAAGGIINYISKRAREEGTHFGVTGRFGTQFDDDSENYKIGATIAHKSGGLDVFAAGSYLTRGVTYDANGRRIGISASSSLADSKQYSLFGKVGYNFGEGDSQRIEGVASFFYLKANGDYHYVAGVRPPIGTNQTKGIPDTAEPGPPTDPVTGQLLFKPDFNRFQQYALNYSNADLFGGDLVATAYYAKQEMRFPGDNGIDKQDPRISPGVIFDQSEILSKKYGLRTSYTHKDFLTKGFELRFGVDIVHDQTQQFLAVTNRVWVPPMNYLSFGPYAQLSYDIGPVTLSGGWRHEDGTVKVNDYTTTYYRNSRFVKGGKIRYKEDLFNGSGIVRLGHGFSAFASYGEGFTLPNFGIPLRNVSVPNQSVETLLPDLQAVIFRNKEIGLNWRGRRGSAGVSYYQSKSDLGAGLLVDPVTKDYVISRRPQNIYGFDFSAEFRPMDTLRLNALFSHVIGKTTSANGVTSPVNVPLGILNIAPDKATETITWQFVPAASVSLGATTFISRNLPQIKEYTHGYTLFDLTANYRVKNLATFSLGIENMFNKFYFLQSSQIDIYQNYFAGRGRTVSLTVHRDF
ncbi:TonB-dependent receptor domain-containing protein [Sphingomonas sp. BAUL-RG-20F-R05-02]|uniref:TonB-dependent receptor domain-containing protein n=1 Tax=Sphingomonas sp. BAUL-RG-20F-R05-02 TaxID=2914830 RepID=UPI0024124717|nr:TonB-dependent receptor [Sphingomonas sp. BAUL-RG-20F-R05-02]